MPLVTPEPGEDLALLAQTLLALADHPREVTYVVGDHLFTVSDAVADRYLMVLTGTSSDDEPKPKATKKAAPAKKTTAKES
jgi:hypothetical protein